MKPRALALAVFVVLTVGLTSCAYHAPSATGTIVDMEMKTATIERDCDTVSAVPYVEDCDVVRQPDSCFVWVETPDETFVRAEIRCERYETISIGDDFTDGQDVLASVCARHDENRRWESIAVQNGDCTGLERGR